MTQQIIRSGDGTNYDWANDHIYVKAPDDLSAGRVTLVEDRLKPGFHLPRHYHKTMLEIFYILQGTIEFRFDEETVVVGSGDTVNIPPMVYHEVLCAEGAKMLTIFSPGGFDRYLAELAALSPDELNDMARTTALSEKYDTWLA